MKKMSGPTPQAKNLILTGQGPLLPGSLSTARSTCGKPHCACKAHPPKLHGPYYRWTGIAEGKRTTITLNQEERAFTTEAPTPCNPPDTWYVLPPNFAPA